MKADLNFPAILFDLLCSLFMKSTYRLTSKVVAKTILLAIKPVRLWPTTILYGGNHYKRWCFDSFLTPKTTIKPKTTMKLISPKTTLKTTMRW